MLSGNGWFDNSTTRYLNAILSDDGIDSFNEIFCKTICLEEIAEALDNHLIPRDRHRSGRRHLTLYIAERKPIDFFDRQPRCLCDLGLRHAHRQQIASDLNRVAQC